MQPLVHENWPASCGKMINQPSQIANNCEAFPDTAHYWAWGLGDDEKILSPASRLFRDLFFLLLFIKTFPAFDLHHEAIITGVIVHITDS